MRDLEPYLCTLPNCDHALRTYSSRGDWTDHEISHDLAIGFRMRMHDCIFCDEVLNERESHRERHLGRHMEEIAFTAVAKLHEEWAFYSDSSSAASDYGA